MKRIAIFASGSGTNTQRIIEYFRGNDVLVALVICNNPKADVIERAHRVNVPIQMIEKEKFYGSDLVVKKLQMEKIDLLVLAGFLWMIPQNILRAFPKKIINIHPALLPKFGGKGMFGMNVHKAVIDAGEKESGITIHYVNEKYDEGEIILQKKCSVTSDDTAETLAQKIHTLEYEWYPKTVEQLLKS